MRYLFILLLLFSFARAQNNSALDYVTANSEFCRYSGAFLQSDQTGFISMWVEPDALGAGVAIYFFGSTANAVRAIKIYILADGMLRINQRDNDVEDRVNFTTTTITVNNKWHIVLGSDGSDWLAWINGVSQTASVDQGANSGDWNGDTGSQNHITIGAIWNSGGVLSPYDGIIDEAAYFSGVTPTQEIVNQIYNGGTPKNIATMTGISTYWRFEEGSGQAVDDKISTFDLTLGADGSAAGDDPAWLASPFGWDFGFKSFKQHSAHNKFKGF